MLKTPKTDAEKLTMPRHWRLVKQSRKIGGPFYLKDGFYRRNPLSGQVQWITNNEWDYKTRQAAIEALKKMPLSWGGDRSLILKSEEIR